jgi:hypothetical protein
MLLTSHGQVLFHVAAYPDATIPQIARTLGLSERRVGVILRDLKEDGMLRVTRIGRRNRYDVNAQARFRHPSLAHVQLSELLSTFVPREDATVWPARRRAMDPRGE